MSEEKQSQAEQIIFTLMTVGHLTTKEFAREIGAERSDVSADFSNLKRLGILKFSRLQKRENCSVYILTADAIQTVLNYVKKGCLRPEAIKKTLTDYKNYERGEK